jgi:hypothetical protein
MTSTLVRQSATTQSTTTQSTTTLTWQLLLQARPAQVYQALERAASEDGRFRAGDAREGWLVFSGAPGGPSERTTLCAFVREHDSGTLLQFGPADGHVNRVHATRSESAELAEVAEAASIGSLVHRMRSHLGAIRMQLPVN